MATIQGYRITGRFTIVRNMSKIFDISTVKGIQAAERFKARMNDRFESVNVYAIDLTRVQIVALRPIAPRLASEYGNDEIRWPDGLQNY